MREGETAEAEVVEDFAGVGGVGLRVGVSGCVIKEAVVWDVGGEGGT